jgi:hypothetical protein
VEGVGIQLLPILIIVGFSALMLIALVVMSRGRRH